jgi:hypothetical protein
VKVTGKPLAEVYNQINNLSNFTGTKNLCSSVTQRGGLMKNKVAILLLSCIVICVMACDWDENNIMPPFSQTWKALMGYDGSGATRLLNVAAVGFDADLSPEINRNKIIAFYEFIITKSNGTPNIYFIRHG